MAIAKVGDVFKTNAGFLVEIVEYIGAYDVRIKFFEPEEHFRWCRIGDLRKGKVTNFLERVYFGVGYIGYGKYTLKPRGNESTGSTWYHMMSRCYDYKIKDLRYPSYAGCTVSEQWYNYQNFAEFYYSDPYRQLNWELDKDLILIGNKEYGPDTCAFIPKELNNLLQLNKSNRGKCLIGVTKVTERVNKSKPYCAKVNDGDKVISRYFKSEIEAFYFYKETKESVVRKRITEYDGKIDPRVLESLSKWSVKIDD